MSRVSLLRRSQRRLALAALIGGGLVIPLNVSASPLTATFQNGGTTAANNAFVSSYTGAQDSSIIGSTATAANYGYGGAYDVTVRPANKYYAILQFDLSAIPANSITVQSATLTVTGDIANSSAAPYSWHAINPANAGWKAGPGAALETTGGATYNNKASFGVNDANNVAWSGGPGLGYGTATPGYDITSMGSGSWTTGAHDKQTVNLTPSTVQGWIDHPSTNAGMMLVSDNGSTYLVFKQSVEPGDTGTQPSVADHPMLVITYQAVPEPASLSLLGLGGLLLLRRRKEA